MTSVGKKVAVGAVWMVGLKLTERSIGFVSTLILARLLTPADFGLVAMAMAVYAFIEVAGQFGFDVALIRNQKADPDQYHCAWTLSACYGLLAGLVLVGLASPVAQFFSEPRLEPVIWVLAAVSVIQGWESVGIVNFRKEFRFGREFQIFFFKKLVSFIITISLALTLRTYWALIAGIATSRLTGVALSYILHPYRPRVSFARTSELFRFSKWIVLTRIIQYVGDRGPDFIIGRALGASTLGLYRVGREVSTLPTSELIFPIMRAVFPGYAAVAHSRTLLAEAFLKVQGSIVMLSLPAGIAIAMLADPLVRVVLGGNWLASIPVIQMLGIYGALTVFQATNASILNVLGLPQWNTALKALEVIVVLSAILLLLSVGYGLQGVVWAIVGTQLLMLPIGMAIIGRLLGIRIRDRLGVVWRPVLSTAVMALVIALLADMHWAISMPPLGILIACALAGGSAYVLTAILLWRLAGGPEGTEMTLLKLLRERFKGGQPRIAGG